MKVLERVPWSHVFHCTGCKSKLQCEAADVKYGVSGMDAEGGYYCECPECGTQYDLFNAKVPTSIAGAAYEAFEKRNGRRR